MTEGSVEETTSLAFGLMVSHMLVTSSTKRPTPSQAPTSPIYHGPSSSRPHTPRTPRTPLQPTTPRPPLSPSTTCAPRKRSLYEHDAATTPTAPRKRNRTSSHTPESTPSKPCSSRRRKIIPLDRAVCIPMEVLRAQNDDTSALLRPPPRRSDQLRKLVDMSVGRTLEKLRSPGSRGILEAAVWMPGRKGEAWFAYN